MTSPVAPVNLTSADNWRRTLGSSTSPHLLDGRLLLHCQGRALDLSCRLGAGALCGLPARWLCADFMDWRPRMCWHNRLATAPRLRCQRRDRHNRGTPHSMAYHAARRHVYGRALRGVSVAALGELSNWPRAPVVVATADGGVGQSTLRLRRGPRSAIGLRGRGTVGNDFR